MRPYLRDEFARIHGHVEPKHVRVVLRYPRLVRVEIARRASVSVKRQEAAVVPSCRVCLDARVVTLEKVHSGDCRCGLMDLDPAEGLPGGLRDSPALVTRL